MHMNHRGWRVLLSTGLGLGLGILAAILTPGFAEQPNTARHHFSLAGKRLIYHQPNVVSHLVLSNEDTEGRMTFQDEVWKTGMTVGSHFHKKHFEVFYVITGQVEWTVGGETHLMGAGDAVYIPANTVHSARVVGNQDAHMLFLFEPGGFEERAIKEQNYTEEQRKDPKLQKELNILDDVHPISEH